MPPDAESFEVQGPLTHYKSSDQMTRSFCSNCGANVNVKDEKDPFPDICTGTIENEDEVMRLGSHIFVPSSQDGGLSDWLPDVPAYEGYSSSNKIHIPLETKPKRSSIRNNAVPAYCQCKGVEFNISCPNAASIDLSSPWSDLLKPYVSGSSENEQDVKWWLRANDTKWLAGTCACDSCRRSSGFDIQTWAFVPKANILLPNGKPINFNIGTLKRYQSSPGVYREFCSRCGATMFWHCDKRPELIDVSVGLLDAEDGARAEAYLEWWTDRVSFEEEAHNKPLIKSLSDGLKRWGKSKSDS